MNETNLTSPHLFNLTSLLNFFLVVDTPTKTFGMISTIVGLDPTVVILPSYDV